MAQASAIRTAVSLALLMAGFGLLVASYWLPWHHIGNPSARVRVFGLPVPDLRLR